jgi:hypothetical protein
MSDYTEHLISMAGGDGEPVDQLAAIEARQVATIERLNKGDANMSDGLYAMGDRRTLLALVRTQAAQIERVLDLANTRSRCGWQISADEIRKALTATEGA